MAELFSNDAITTLAAGMLAGDATLSVANASAFPASGNFRIRIDNEILTVTGVSGTTFTVSRATEACAGVQAAAAHSAGAVVEHVLTAASVALASSGVPAGVIVPYAGSSAPSGWLLCDGSSVSTTTYAALFAVTGYTYGGIGGSFNLPDLRDRVPIGVSPGSLSGNRPTARTLGGTGGEETHTLSTGEMPSHVHSLSGLGIDTGTATIPNSDSGDVMAGAGSSLVSCTANTGSQGFGSGHNTMPPFLVLNYLIKT